MSAGNPAGPEHAPPIRIHRIPPRHSATRGRRAHACSVETLRLRSGRVTDEQQQAASDTLWRHWQDGERIVALSTEQRPLTREDGYAIQARLERRSGFPLFGWKIAATSTAGQAHIAVDGPMAGRLLAERVFASGRRLTFGANSMRVAEAEFAFRLGDDVPPRATPYATAEVLACVEALHPAIEVPDSRYVDFTAVGAPQLIADNACAHQFVLGPPARG